MPDVAAVEALVDRLFEAFGRGDWDAAGRCFAPGGTILGQWGPAAGGKPQPWSAARKGLEQTVRMFGSPRYLDRQRFCASTFFVERHSTELTPVGGKPVRLPVVLFGKVDPATGLVASLEEYLDPSPLVKEAKRAAKAGTTKAPADAAPPVPGGAVAIVTGASSGIGEGIAVACAAAGCRLVLTARREGELRRVAQRCQQAGARGVEVVAGDGSDAQVVQRVAAAAERLGGADRLYINAGISQYSHFMESAPDAVPRMMEVNLYAGVEMTRVVLPQLLRRKGRIAVVTSGFGRLVAPYNTAYCASKHAQHGFFEALRCEVEPKGVKVTMVLPGGVNTPILSNLQGAGGQRVAFQMTDEARARMPSGDDAGKWTVDACEAGLRECIFRGPDKWIRDRMLNQAAVDKQMTNMYEKVMKAAKL
eukprot:TRINITY_DN56599_c0_g1_i1.p1 TRINITY_DN56599_c0_g1~~TRINITY_DN56599_c0_g1_i1.p1  ORF type:complete len:445 (+),score=108.45 TRINITY_DN56599_c0_g1_i1:78-1337(+)